MATTRLPRLPRGPLLASAAVLLFVALNELAGWWTGSGGLVICSVRRLTGYPCPGCGSTRMVRALLSGDPLRAFALNPLMCVVVVCGGVHLLVRIAFARRLEVLTTARRRRVAGIGLLAAVALNWIYLLIRGV